MRTMRMEREDIENSLKVLSHIVDDDFIITVDEARKIIGIDGETIEALQAELPKRGEWQKAKPKGIVTYSDGYAECSHCHEAIWLGWWMNFCPNCGTQNRIIDPDDYEVAKMEVRE